MVADEDAVRVSAETPLTILLDWKLAETPEGNPEAAKVTVPDPNEFTRSATTALPEDIV